MAMTTFVGHTPGTHKVYNIIGGWSLMYLDLAGNSHNDSQVYTDRAEAERERKSRNRELKFCRKAGIPIMHE